MSEIRKYVVVDADDHEDDYEYDSFDEAKTAASERNEAVAVVARVYTYDDSELAWTSTGHTQWPPPKESTCRNCGEDIEFMTDGEPPWVHVDSGVPNCGDGHEDFHAEPTDG